MLRKVILQNFMAHVHTELELVDGLNVLVGPNNCGKSAVISALWMLATVPSREGDYMLRHGQRECSVTVETAEGHTLIWKRQRNGSPKLIINGEELTRLANDQAHVLSRLQPLLKLPQVGGDAGREAFDVHFALQKEPIFLLNSESAAATFFASSSDASRLLQMQSRFKERVREKKKTRSDAVQDRARLEVALLHLAPLEQIAPQLEFIHGAHAALAGSLAREAQLDRDAAAIQTAARSVSAVAAEADALKPLLSPPEMVDVSPFLKLLTQLSRQGTLHSHHSGEVATLTPLRDPPALHDVQPLAQLRDQLTIYTARTDDFDRRCTALAVLADPPLLTETAPLARLIEDLRLAIGKQRTAALESEVLQPLTPPPELAVLAPIVSDLAALRSASDVVSLRMAEVSILDPLTHPCELVDPEPLMRLTGSIDAAEAEAARRMKELDQAGEALRAWLAEHPSCPHCGSRIDTIDGEALHVHA